MSDNNPDEILLDLKKSFLDDKRELQDRIVELETRIKQASEFIESLNRKDDNEYSLFSPRSTSKVYKDQIYEKKLEIEELEEQLRVYYRKLSNITKKIDSLNSLSPESVNIVNPSVSFEPKESSLYLQLQEEDRQRIAADLHDSVLQNLSLVMHNLELSQKFIDYDPVRAKLELESNRKLVKEIIDDIRSTIFDLRPMQFDDFGFKKTMENLLDAYKERTDIEIEYRIDELEGRDNIVLLTVFRIIQELVSNSIKHSGGSKIEVSVLDEKSRIYIEESDNGVGLPGDSENKDYHYGLKILKERINSLNGTYRYASVVEGSKMIIEIPV